MINVTYEVQFLFRSARDGKPEEWYGLYPDPIDSLSEAKRLRREYKGDSRTRIVEVTTTERCVEDGPVVAPTPIKSAQNPAKPADSSKLSRNQEAFLQKWKELGVSYAAWDWGWEFFDATGAKVYGFAVIRGVTRTLEALLKRGLLERNAGKVMLV